jgi:hypothetical protein
MLEPEFSRRVAKLMHTEVIQTLGIRGRFDFADRVEAAENYEGLAKSDRQLVLRAEAEVAAKTGN